MYFEPEISFLFGWTFSIICAILAEGTAVTRMPKFADWKREAVNYKITVCQVLGRIEPVSAGAVPLLVKELFWFD